MEVKDDVKGEFLVDEIMAEAEASAAAELGEAPPQDEPKPADAPIQGEQAAPKDEPKAEPAPTDPVAKEETPGGVLAADGKSVIPYGALKAARHEAQAERNARIELEAEVARLTAAAATGTVDPQADAKLTALMEKVKNDFSAIPELADVLTPLVETISVLQRDNAAIRAKADRFDQYEANRQAEAAATAKDSVQAAIDSNPTLLYWQNNDPQRWNFAAQQDAYLRESEIGKSLSLAERFDKAVKATEAIFGPTQLPAEFARPTNAVPDNQGDVQKRAEEKLAEAQAAKSRVSLSDIPGGAPPASADRALAEMSVGEVADKMDAMLAKGMSLQDIAALYG